MSQSQVNPPWFVRKDLEGFFGLMIDNLIQLILIVSLCRELIHLPDSYIFGKILPGAAISILVGNFFYAWQARRLAHEKVNGPGIFFRLRVWAKLVQVYHRRNRPGAGGALRVHGRGVGLHHQLRHHGRKMPTRGHGRHHHGQEPRRAATAHHAEATAIVHRSHVEPESGVALCVRPHGDGGRARAGHQVLESRRREAGLALTEICLGCALSESYTLSKQGWRGADA